MRGFNTLMTSAYLPDYFVENVLRCALPFEDKGEISEA